jgi:hypothetical protein
LATKKILFVWITYMYIWHLTHAGTCVGDDKKLSVEIVERKNGANFKATYKIQISNININININIQI